MAQVEYERKAILLVFRFAKGSRSAAEPSGLVSRIAGCHADRGDGLNALAEQAARGSGEGRAERKTRADVTASTATKHAPQLPEPRVDVADAGLIERMVNGDRAALAALCARHAATLVAVAHCIVRDRHRAPMQRSRHSEAF
jgi:hypothetical protein